MSSLYPVALDHNSPQTQSGTIAQEEVHAYPYGNQLNTLHAQWPSRQTWGPQRKGSGLIIFHGVEGGSCGSPRLLHI